MRRKFRLTFYYSDMPLTNNVMIVRHKLLTNLIKLWKDNQLVERIDRLPIELSPRTSRVLGRCCVHKERAVWKYKSFPLMVSTCPTKPTNSPRCPNMPAKPWSAKGSSRKTIFSA